MLSKLFHLLAIRAKHGNSSEYSYFLDCSTSLSNFSITPLSQLLKLRVHRQHEFLFTIGCKYRAFSQLPGRHSSVWFTLCNLLRLFIGLRVNVIRIESILQKQPASVHQDIKNQAKVGESFYFKDCPGFSHFRHH